jgi:hypothetical protein
MSLRVKFAVAALVVLITVAVVWASSCWPQRVQAVSASLGFLTAGLLVCITWKYVEENQKIRKLMEKQWKESGRVHVSYWLEVNPAEQSKLGVVYKRDFTVIESGALLVPAVNLRVWNAGLHAFRLRRVRLKIPPAPSTGRTIDRNIVVGAEKTESLNIATEVLQVISNSTAIEFEKVRLHSEDLEIALDCSGLYEKSSPAGVFRIDTKETEGRLEITVVARSENGNPP